MSDRARPGCARSTAAMRRALAAVVLAACAAAAPAAAAAAAGPPGHRDTRERASMRARAAQSHATPRARLRAALGEEGRVDVDAATGDVAVVGRTDGFLTGPSARPAEEVALDYVADHDEVFGLSDADLRTLEPRARQVLGSGAVRLTWRQVAGGVPFFDSMLRATVTAGGRLVSVVGSPRAGAARAPGPSRPALTAAEASSEALGDLRLPRLAPARRPDARLVRFATATGTRLGWRVVVEADLGRYVSVVDATGGDVLWRGRTTRSHTVEVWDDFPYRDGTGDAGATVREVPTSWLPAAATRLRGPNVHVFSDVDGGDTVSAGEEIEPRDATSFVFAFTPFTVRDGPSCGGPWNVRTTCAWDPETPFSWQANREQNAAQVFWFANVMHDHLAAAPVGFTPEWGSFEGGDRLIAETRDGADTDAGLPDAEHVDNADMTTPPDGESPRMQTYLAADPAVGDFGDEGETVFHEYAHGLNARLVTTALGDSALDADQPAALDEAWADWWALDLLHGRGLRTDDPGAVDVQMSPYLDPSRAGRTQNLDCLPSSPPAACPGAGTAGAGGYTYGDLGRIHADGAQPHADGEIWGETLWQLRSALVAAHGAAEGVVRARRLVADGERLAPPNPTFLQARDAVLQADRLAGCLDRARIWTVFASRGMGPGATSNGANDASVDDDFTLPLAGAGACPAPPRPEPPQAGGTPPGGGDPAPDAPAPDAPAPDPVGPRPRAPTVAEIADGVRASLSGAAVRLRSVRLGRLRAVGSAALPFAFVEGGRVEARVTISRATARALGVALRGRRRILVARGVRTAARGTIAAVTVRLTRDGRRAARRARRRLGVALALRFTGGAATRPVAGERRVVLRR